MAILSRSQPPQWGLWRGCASVNSCWLCLHTTASPTHLGRAQQHSPSRSHCMKGSSSWGSQKKERLCVYQSVWTRLWCSNKHPENLSARHAQTDWTAYPGFLSSLFWFPSEKLQIKKENSKTRVTSHISSARASLVSISDFSGGKEVQSLPERGGEHEWKKIQSTREYKHDCLPF